VRETFSIQPSGIGGLLGSNDGGDGGGGGCMVPAYDAKDQ
jgi:hypothetical protein